MFNNEFELICHEEKIVHVFSLLVSPGEAAQISGNDVQAHGYSVKTIHHLCLSIVMRSLHSH